MTKTKTFNGFTVINPKIIRLESLFSEVYCYTINKKYHLRVPGETIYHNANYFKLYKRYLLSANNDIRDAEFVYEEVKTYNKKRIKEIIDRMKKVLAGVKMTANIYKRKTFSRSFINKRLDKINEITNTKQFILQTAELLFKLSGNVNVTQRLNVMAYRG